MAKPTYSFRLSKELVELAREADIDLSALIEASIAKRLKVKKCPFCGASQ